MKCTPDLAAHYTHTDGYATICERLVWVVQTEGEDGFSSTGHGG